MSFQQRDALLLLLHQRVTFGTAHEARHASYFHQPHPRLALPVLVPRYWVKSEDLVFPSLEHSSEFLALTDLQYRTILPWRNRTTALLCILPRPQQHSLPEHHGGSSLFGSRSNMSLASVNAYIL